MVTSPGSQVTKVLKSDTKMKKEESIRTHGYVHGHIHKHGDHTHIHGHIHNHDHDKLRITDPKFPGAKRKECTEFDDDILCKDILCGELDDCFFLTCDDYNDQGCSESECIECAKERNLEDVTCCENSECLRATTPPDDSYICDTKTATSLCEYPSAHENNLCDLQSSKIPIFEDLIDKVYQTLDNQQLNQIQKKGIADPSKDFQLHFPHECHALGDTNSMMHCDSPNHHHLHQSCFHTMIPNTSYNMDMNSGAPVSDYDFFVQFDNFNQMINNQALLDKSPSSVTSQDVASSKTESSLLPADHEQKYSCLWDNCQVKVDEDEFLKHLVEQHIAQQYSTPFKHSGYKCEWNECSFMDSDLDSLILHMNSHKDQQFSTVPDFQLLTPVSSSLSSFDSPSILPKQDEDVNITSMSIFPKNTEHEDQRTEGSDNQTKSKCICCWQVGIDEYGHPIKCSEVFESENELQSHLINSHIGSGKSSYSCDWVGCDRHNGKRFIQRQKLLRHIHIHTKFKPFKCDVCGSKFATRPLLNQHTRVHSGEKPYQCSTCNKRFATSSSLSIHHRVHTGEKPLVCKVCNKRFSESSNLAKHMKTHLKLFKCESCGAQFDDKSSYNKHLKLHSVQNVSEMKYLLHSTTT
ncbi:uncharacterized protein PRCAT00004930001 [Priceomyces carsonii]|uniref:uncharacterized protein n=1 Tax=Priceomyces carsonii TaxID=28549 RepID=UPI002EDA06C7|nr:unnamed protein product [Priceomyces carsonii]